MKKNVQNIHTVRILLQTYGGICYYISSEQQRDCPFLDAGSHGGSGMGANEPYNGRYYLVSPDLWKKEKGNYCMVHDSVLPGAWGYYEKNGVLLLEENDHPGRITNEVLLTVLSSLDSEILDLFA